MPALARTGSTRALWANLLLVVPACLLAPEARAQGPGDDAKDFKSALTYDGTVLGNTRSGARRGVGYIGALHLRLTLDAPSGSLLEGTTGYLDVLSLQGGAAGNASVARKARATSRARAGPSSRSSGCRQPARGSEGSTRRQGRHVPARRCRPS